MKPQSPVVVKTADSSRLVPVASMSKVHATFVTANRNIIVYSSSKKGMVRVICQEDASRLILDTNKYGDILGMALASYGEACILAVACKNGVLLWTLPHSKLDPELIAPHPTRVIPIHESTIITCIKFEPGSNSLVLSCTHTGDDSGEIYVIDVACMHVDEEQDVRVVMTSKFPSPIDKFDFYPGDISRVAVLMQNKQILCWNRAVSGTNNAATPNNGSMSTDAATEPLVNSPLDVGKIVSIECLSCDCLAVIGENGIAVVTAGNICDSMPIDGVVALSAYFAPWLVLITTEQQMVLVTVENGKILAASMLEVKLGIKNLCLTENLGRESNNVAFEAYLFHTSGVSILSVVKGDLPLKQTNKQNQSFHQQQHQFTCSTAIPDTESRAGNSYNRKSKRKNGNIHSPNNTTEENLAETFSRTKFQEKNYSIHELISSGLFVTRAMFDEQEKCHKAEVRRLESKLDKMLDMLRKQQNEPKRALKQRSVTTPQVQNNLHLTDDESFPSMNKDTLIKDQEKLAENRKLESPTNGKSAESWGARLAQQPQPSSIEESTNESEDSEDQSQGVEHPSSESRKSSNTLAPKNSVVAKKQVSTDEDKGAEEDNISICATIDNPSGKSSEKDMFSIAQKLQDLIQACSDGDPDLSAKVESFVAEQQTEDLELITEQQMLCLSAFAALSLAINQENSKQLIPWFEELTKIVNPSEFHEARGLVVSVLNQVKNNLRPFSDTSKCIHSIQDIVLDAY